MQADSAIIIVGVWIIFCLSALWQEDAIFSCLVPDVWPLGQCSDSRSLKEI